MHIALVKSTAARRQVARSAAGTLGPLHRRDPEPEEAGIDFRERSRPGRAGGLSAALLCR